MLAQVFILLFKPLQNTVFPACCYSGAEDTCVLYRKFGKY